MDFWSAAIAITAIGCGTGIVITFIDKVGHVLARAKGQEGSDRELKLARARSAQLESTIIELRRENESLHKQLEWHSKLVEAQDRLVKQLGDGESAERASTLR